VEVRATRLVMEFPFLQVVVCQGKHLSCKDRVNMMTSPVHGRAGGLSHLLRDRLARDDATAARPKNRHSMLLCDQVGGSGSQTTDRIPGTVGVQVGLPGVCQGGVVFRQPGQEAGGLGKWLRPCRARQSLEVRSWWLCVPGAVILAMNRSVQRLNSSSVLHFIDSTNPSRTD
jgi:hypothetical protein